MSVLPDSLPGFRLVRQYQFLGTSPAVDLAGAELLGELHRALCERGIAFRLAEARGEVRETLRRAGFEERFGPVLANEPVATVIEEWCRDAGPYSRNPEARP
jgi:STAS domain